MIRSDDFRAAPPRGSRQTAEAVTTPLFPTLEFEQALWKGGFRHIAGIDEAGRGALAGPVSAAAVILPNTPHLARTLRGVRDSKQMTPLARESWAPRIKEIALAWGVGFASAEEIDMLGIVPATKLAATRAIVSLYLKPDYLITDYLIFPEIPLPQTALVKGDPNLTVLMGDLFGPGMREASQKPVSEVMSPIKVTIQGNDPIAKAIFLMIKENVGLMPVIQDSKVAGMIRLSTLFKEISNMVLGD